MLRSLPERQDFFPKNSGFVQILPPSLRSLMRGDFIEITHLQAFTGGMPSLFDRCRHMPDLERRITILQRSLANQEAATVLLAAMPHASPDEQTRLCEALLATNQPRGVAHVIGRLHEFNDLTRRMSETPPGCLHDAITLVRRGGGSLALLNAVELLRNLADPKLAHHLTAMLESHREDVPQHAGEALLDVLKSKLAVSGRLALSREARDALDGSVAASMDRYRVHRREELLIAAALLSASPGPKLAAILAQPDHPAVLAMRRAARRVSEPLVRRQLIRWIGIDPLRPQALRCLHEVRLPNHRDEMLRDRHLLLSSRRRRAMARVEKPASCLPSPAELMAMSPFGQAAVVDWMVALHVPAAAQLRTLRTMRQLPSPLVRLRAALAASQHVSEEAVLYEESAAVDNDSAVASVALAGLRLRGREISASALSQIERHRHRAGARWAATRLASSHASGFFARWLALDERSRLAAAHRVMDRDAAGMTEELRRRIAASGRMEAIPAIAIARRLDLCEAVCDALFARAKDDDARIASAAVSAMGHIADAEAIGVLTQSLTHGNSRVRANAIESLGRRCDATVELLQPFAEGRENRERANATLTILHRERERGIEYLRDMLTDGDPLHRISAVWAARRARVHETAWEIDRLAEDDPLPEVRVRAASARRLLGARDLEAVSA